MNEEENKLLGKLYSFLKYNSFTDCDINWSVSITSVDKLITTYCCLLCKDFFGDNDKLNCHAQSHLTEAKRIELLKEFL